MTAAMTTDRRERRQVLGAGAALVGAAVLTAAVDPTTSPIGPPCPFHAITGWWCPVCGSTRAVHALLHGDVAAASGLNVLVPIYLLAIGGAWLAWFRRATARPTIRVLTPSRRAVIAIAVLMLAFTVARNLPAGAALAP